ncbi:unnamed protein product [Pylaiella littoralis]
MKFGKKQRAGNPLLVMMTDLQRQQQSIVDIVQGAGGESGERVSILISNLENHAARLELLLERLDSVTEALVDSTSREAAKPWYVRIFCR